MKYISKKLFFIFLLSLSGYTHAFHINAMPIDNIEEQTWSRLKTLFMDTFAQAYKHVDIKEINPNFDTTSHYLQSLFDIDRRNIDNLNFDLIFTAQEEEIVGYILSCYCAEEKKAYIHHLVVDSRNHNKGIAKNLIKACENLYKKATCISLSTRTFNDKAIGFYKHLGFYETNFPPEITYLIRPSAKNNPQILHLEKIITQD